MATSFDPASTAASLATAYTQAAQAQLTAQTQRAQAQSTGLTKLQSALRAFDSAVATLSGKKTMVQHVATFADTSVGTATTSASAQPGSYPLFVEQVAGSFDRSVCAATYAHATSGHQDLKQVGQIGVRERRFDR